MYTSVSLDYDIDRDYGPISLNIEGYCNYYKGSYNIAFECEADILSAKDEFNNNWAEKLTEKEKEDIIFYIIDSAMFSD